jgi:pimeloyl-ACP methyl ester carboxylesterase
MRGLLDFDGRSAAARCTVPALHIAAPPPLNPPQLLSEWLPNLVQGQTVGAGHFNQLEAPEQVNSIIEGFLQHYVHRS